MLFSKPTESSAVRSFQLAISSGSHERQVAFGPGSILNGSVLLTLDRPIQAYNIRVTFKCEARDDSKTKSTLFSVYEYVWGKARTDGQRAELPIGSSMYLFAIKLPHINYPPSMHDTRIGHYIDYILQGSLECNQEAPFGTDTLPVSVLYLPLISSGQLDENQMPSQPAKRSQTFDKAGSHVEMTAELIKSAYCPGDMCTIKLTTSNQSEHKITTIQLTLVSIATTSILPTFASDAPILNSLRQKHHTLHSETFFVSIPKHSQDRQSIIQFMIPSNCVPSTENHVGKYLEIAYEITLTLPLATPGSTWSFPFVVGSSSPSPTIQLPLLIATVPDSYLTRSTVPSLAMPTATDDDNELPHFIRAAESPLPSPHSDRSSFWDSGSPVDRTEVGVLGSGYGSAGGEGEEGVRGVGVGVGAGAGGSASRSGGGSLRSDEEVILESSSAQQDASGHLMVPFMTESELKGSRRRSSGSVASVINESVDYTELLDQDGGLVVQ
ncbi:hypothetical protein J3Q64DRAFT_1744795 [Phycomyces blakesleeanus]|uniref:Arrestin C-terminal-like domain-containing protein n=1 Tax=Phycomyces blakesleeanus TaxID=4837 RepID=A0ABR3B1H0_PHYBL